VDTRSSPLECFITRIKTPPKGHPSTGCLNTGVLLIKIELKNTMYTYQRESKMWSFTTDGLLIWVVLSARLTEHLWDMCVVTRNSRQHLFTVDQSQQNLEETSGSAPQNQHQNCNYCTSRITTTNPKTHSLVYIVNYFRTQLWDCVLCPRLLTVTQTEVCTTCGLEWNPRAHPSGSRKSTSARATTSTTQPLM
jgi:hypothetical protein